MKHVYVNRYLHRSSRRDEEMKKLKGDERSKRQCPRKGAEEKARCRIHSAEMRPKVFSDPLVAAQSTTSRVVVDELGVLAARRLGLGSVSNHRPSEMSRARSFPFEWPEFSWFWQGWGAEGRPTTWDPSMDVELEGNEVQQRVELE